MWQSYILCGSRPDWLNQYNCVEASIASNCQSLNVQKCGLCHYMNSLSDNWGFICQLMVDNGERLSKIVIVKQDPVDLEAMLKKFSLKDSEYTLIPCLKTRENEM